MRPVRLLAVLTAGMLVVVVAEAGEVATRPTSPPFKREDVRGIDEFVGSAQAQEALLEQGFVVTGQQYRQIFEAYLSDTGSQLPKFVTVDSAWHTYHVLLEDGVRQVEFSQAGILRRFSQRLYAIAAGQSDRADGVYRDLAMFAAVGLALQDPTVVEQLPQEACDVVVEVLAAIQGGDPPQCRSLFFGLPLMTCQFRPVSFYAKTPELSRYFGARQWYSTQVFRLNSDTEALRAIHLALLVESDAELKQLYARLTRPFDEIVGPADDPGLAEYARIARDTAASGEVVPSLVEFRREAQRLPAPRVNDQWLLPQEWEARKEVTRGMRVLGPRRLPSAVLFHETTDPDIPGRMFPSGLDVFAAGPLACEAGRRALKRTIPDAATLDAVIRADCGPLPDSLHGQAMRLLTLLQAPVAATAPTVFRSSAWHDKQLGTGLAAWAEERHTWALQAKMSIAVGSMVIEPPGYVSPYPDFYRGLADLARQAAEKLRSAMPDGPDLVPAGEEWLALRKKREQSPPHSQTISEQEMNRLGHTRETYFQEKGRNRHEASAEEYAEAGEEIDAIARRCVEGKGVTEMERCCMQAFVAGPEGEALGLLPEFADLCDRLAAIAQKELDGKRLDSEDAELIRNYGITLARFHFYGASSYLWARDDFPMVVPVFVSPSGNRNETLYAGVARPETIYVIVADGEQATLHRGAVLSYREFCRPNEQTVDDAKWTEEIRAGNAPPSPSWTSSYRHTTSVQDVAAAIRSGKTYPGVSLVPDREITRAMIDALRSNQPGQSEWYRVWLRQELLNRVTTEDMPALFDALAKLPPDEVGEFARELRWMEQVDWGKHRDKLAALLSHRTERVADSVAYLMGSHPESIDVVALADDYEQQPLRTRRLYLYVIGRSKTPGTKGVELILKSLDDPHAAIRYQAAAAVATSGVSTPAVISRLIAGIDDQNEYTAAAMVNALSRLGVKPAAPRMRQRQAELETHKLPEGIAWLPDERTGERMKQREELTEGTEYEGLGNTQVLRCCERWPHDPDRIGSLADELAKGLAELAE